VIQEVRILFPLFIPFPTFLFVQTAIRPLPDETITPPLHDGETNTAPHDMMMTATIHPATETEIEETETAKNDIVTLKSHLPPIIEVPIVTVVEIMALPVVEGMVQVETSMDHPVGEITAPVEVMAMITLLHGIGSLVTIAGEVGQIDLTVQEVEEGMVAVVDLVQEIGNEVLLPNVLVERPQI